ncbi:MAG TPA: hypothetical protein VFF68_03005 [Anaerolineaceae bacterium]|nr:hypothetical protein [Anaerolineaceae bacterium]
MSYTPTNWENEVPQQTPVLYTIKLADGTIIEDDVVIELKTPVTAGTPVNAANLNKIEQGLATADAVAAAAAVTAAAAQEDADAANLPIGTSRLVDGAVTTAKIGTDSVDDTRVGVHVPAMIKRQGGNATAWQVTGAINYDAGNVRLQGGSFSGNTSGSSGTVAVAFPVAFSSSPIVFITSMHDNVIFWVGNAQVNATGFTASWRDVAGGSHSSVSFEWLAIGPE